MGFKGKQNQRNFSERLNFMIKILYLVSTLKSGGPTNQLYYLIEHLDKTKFKPYLITLKNVNDKALINRFESIEGLKIKHIDLNKSKLEKIISSEDFDILHSTGIRGDVLSSKIKSNIVKISTIRTNLLNDYINKFGKIKGRLFYLKHKFSLKKIDQLISVSTNIQQNLKKINFESDIIYNGTQKKDFLKNKDNNLDKYSDYVNFISIGSLIRLKNTKEILESFIKLDDKTKNLFILGDGILKEELAKEYNSNNIHFVGHTKNIYKYLNISDYFLSASISEGLPNSVLEALNTGNKCILSNIDAHMELYNYHKDNIIIYNNENELTQILSKMNTKKATGESILNEIFTAKNMSCNYQKKYLKILGGNK